MSPRRFISSFAAFGFRTLPGGQKHASALLDKRLDSTTIDINEVERWVKNLKIGDEAAIVTDPENLPAGECSPTRILRINKKWLVCSSGRQFYFSGRERSRNGTTRLHPITNEIRVEVWHRRALRSLRKPASDLMHPEQFMQMLLAMFNSGRKVIGKLPAAADEG
jgi:hypothetical protein